jgi:hypothetical protein
MPCFLDDAELTADAANLSTPATLGTWLDAARRQAGDAGRVVVEVRLNDVRLGHEQLDEHLANPVRSDDRLQLDSAAPAELGAEALGEARTELTALAALQQTAAEQLQADHAGEALTQVGQAVQHWIHVANAVTQIARLTQLELETLTVPTPDAELPASTIIAGLSASLVELRELIQSGDTTALADALGYEWPTVIERWDALLAAMGDRLAG